MLWFVERSVAKKNTRRSHWPVFYKIGALKQFAKHRGIHLQNTPFSSKVTGSSILIVGCRNFHRRSFPVTFLDTFQHNDWILEYQLISGFIFVCTFCLYMFIYHIFLFTENSNEVSCIDLSVYNIY